MDLQEEGLQGQAHSLNITTSLADAKASSLGLYLLIQ